MYEILREFSTDFVISPSECLDARGNDLRKEMLEKAVFSDQLSVVSGHREQNAPVLVVRWTGDPVVEWPSEHLTTWSLDHLLPVY
jgi:hypothetical protein